MTNQWVVPLEEGSQDLQPLLGGKGAGLAEMLRLGIPTLPGFIITTEAWKTHTPGSRSLIPDLWKEVRDVLTDLEAKTGKVFGSPIDPLIVSVRSSPPISMPGQLKTILNVGLTAAVIDGLARLSEDPGFGRDTLARLAQMYGEAVHGIPKGRLVDSPEDAEQMGSTVGQLLALFRKETGEDFPQDPYVQLQRGVAAVFDSWFGDNARQYREDQQIPQDQGTAVVVQQMAFGNLGPDSGSGVVFSRNPATGERGLYGEYLSNSQGEQLVAGVVTPRSISDLGREWPEVYGELEAACSRLEKHFRDVQDVEFTVERGRLWILQTRAAKRTPHATLKTLVDMADEGLITRTQAVHRVKPGILEELAGAALFDSSAGERLACGIQSGPGAAVGKIALDRDQVAHFTAKHLPVILVTEQTSADDAAIMPLVSGILTQHGGATSHAAVVARGLGKPCVVGCEGMEIDRDERVVRLGNVRVREGDEISIDGSTGRVYRGSLELVSQHTSDSEELRTLLSWADELSRLRILADASTPAEIEAVLEWGVEGVGLCRTERLYFDSAYLPLFRQAILADSAAGSQRALDELRRSHREEFRALLRATKGRRLWVRLLDAPVDHFLPDREALLTELAEIRVLYGWNEEIGTREALLRAVDGWRQSNPDFALRGVRLASALPEVAEAQIEALLGAACDVPSEELPSDLGILIPFVTHVGEIRQVLRLIQNVAHRLGETTGARISYRLGAMIETPRAAAVAGQLSSVVDLLCIDSDALTETVFSASREDGRRFLTMRSSDGQASSSPFPADVQGVGVLMRLAIDQARASSAECEIAIRGSHVQDRSMLAAFDEWGVDFVCCQPSRLLKARLTAGQVASGA